MQNTALRQVSFHKSGPTAEEHDRHGAAVQTCFGNGRENASGIKPSFALDDGFHAVVHTVRAAAQDIFNLRTGKRQIQASAHLLRDLIQTADHAQLQAAARSCVRDAVVQPHDIHGPAANVREDHGRFVQQIAVLEDRSIALREQLHILHRSFIRNPFIRKRDRLALAQQIRPECFLFPAEARQRQASRKDHRRCGRRVPVCDLFGNGRQRQ